MDARVISLLLCFTWLYKDSSAILWSSSAPPDGTTIYACDGNEVTFDWTFTLDTGDQVVDVEWYFRAPGNQTQDTIGGLINGHFLTDRERLEHVPVGGLKLKGVTTRDSGLYSVRLNYRNSSGFFVNTSSARLQLSVPPVLTDGHVKMQRTPGAVFDNREGDWSVQLECGHFEDLGSPPVDVEWTIPGGDQIHSTAFVNGSFILRLHTYNASGDYSCAIADTSDAMSCMSVHDARRLLTPSGLRVDIKDVLVDILLAERGALSNKVEEVTRELQTTQQLRQTVANLTSQLQHTEDNVISLTSQLQEQENKTQVLQAQLQECLCIHSHTPNQLLSPQSYIWQKIAPTCQDTQTMQTGNGVRMLNVTGISPPICAYCDQDTDSGGWTVIQRRRDGSVNFNRVWAEYQAGFGDPAGEYWLGLETMYRMTSSQSYEIRFDLQMFNGTTGFAVYSNFSTGPSSDFYRLHVGPIKSGNLSDQLYHNNGAQFSTVDMDNDQVPSNCAVLNGGGWWYSGCSWIMPNSPYSHNSICTANYGWACPLWYTFGLSGHNSLQNIEIKIRPM